MFNSFFCSTKSESFFDEENTSGYRFVNTKDPEEIGPIGMGKSFPGFDTGLKNLLLLFCCVCVCAKGENILICIF